MEIWLDYRDDWTSIICYTCNILIFSTHTNKHRTRPDPQPNPTQPSDLTEPTQHNPTNPTSPTWSNPTNPTWPDPTWPDPQPDPPPDPDTELRIDNFVFTSSFLAFGNRDILLLCFSRGPIQVCQSIFQVDVLVCLLCLDLKLFSHTPRVPIPAQAFKLEWVRWSSSPGRR